MRDDYTSTYVAPNYGLFKSWHMMSWPERIPIKASARIARKADRKPLNTKLCSTCGQGEGHACSNCGSTRLAGAPFTIQRY